MKIGFVDHHLNNFHANKFLALLHGPLAELGGKIVCAWESHPTGEDWCAKNGIPRGADPAEVAAKSDAVMVLAPDNIEAHPGLCAQVLPAGKPTLIDKFLATTAADAREIVEKAKAHRTPIFSSSSLRFAGELQAALKEGKTAPTDAFTRGMGDWDGYGVHTLALAVGAMGAEVKRLIDTGNAGSACVTLEYRDGRRAWVEVRNAANMWEALPWSFGLRCGDRYVTRQVKDYDGFYANLMRCAVEFFTTRKSAVSVEEMLKVVAILEGAKRSRHEGGKWVEV